MKRSLNKIILAFGIFLVIWGGFYIHNYKKYSQAANSKQVEMAKLQEFNINLKSDDIESYDILAGDYGGFRGDGDNLIRYKLKDSLPLDKIFKKDTSKDSKKYQKIDRRSDLKSNDIAPSLNELKKLNYINTDMEAAIKKEGFLEKDREFAYEKLYNDDSIDEIGIVSYNKEKKEILFYFSRT